MLNKSKIRNFSKKIMLSPTLKALKHLSTSRKGVKQFPICSKEQRKVQNNKRI